MAGERTEKATPKRLREARAHGQVPSSRDLTGSCVLAAGLLTLAIRGEGIAERARALAERALGYASNSGPELGPGSGLAVASLSEGMALAAAEFASLFLALVLTGIFVSFVQVGPLFTLEPLRPRLDRVAPLARSWKRYFSADVLIVPGKVALKFLCAAGIAAAYIYSERGVLLALPRAGPASAGLALARVLGGIAAWSVSALLAVGLVDLLYQRSRLAKELRMSKEEKRAESRAAEGGNLTKSARRSLGLGGHARLMAEAMERARFVVIEPGGAACAFQWVDGQAEAPQLLAKGQGSLAMAMTGAARRLGVPVSVDAALARGGYQLEVGQVIGEELYAAARAALG